MSKQEWIAQQKQAYPDLSDEELMSLLNTPVEIPNPISQPQIPIDVSVETIAANIPPAERFAIQETKTYEHLVDAIDQKNVTWVISQVENLVAAGVMSQESLTLVQPLFIATQPDPNWTETVWLSPAEQAGFTLLITDF
jgi:hypothetical protein